MKPRRNWLRPSRRISFLALLLGTLAATPAFAAPWSLDQLAAQIAVQKPAALRFTELKYLSALKTPLKQEGEVRFTPPATLERLVRQPKAERFLVRGNQVEMQRGQGRPQQFDLAKYPPLQIFVGAFVATLAGDTAQLQKNYDLKVTGHEYAWTLELKPRDPQLLKQVKLIRVSGARKDVQQFETLQANGDRSVMFFSLLPTQ